jgi:hypothetical protein
LQTGCNGDVSGHCPPVISALSRKQKSTFILRNLRPRCSSHPNRLAEHLEGEPARKKAAAEAAKAKLEALKKRLGIVLSAPSFSAKPNNPTTLPVLASKKHPFIALRAVGRGVEAVELAGESSLPSPMPVPMSKPKITITTSTMATTLEETHLSTHSCTP